MSRLPLVACALTLTGLACSTPTGPIALAQWEHQAFYGLDQDTVWLEVDAEGVSWANEDVAATRNAQLTRAWESGKTPAAPLIGRDHAMWVRALDARVAVDGSLVLSAKALAPYPIRFSLIAMEDGEERLLGQLESEAWSVGTHFAKVEADYLVMHPEALLILRTEGAHQAVESRLRLAPVQSAAR